MWARSASSGASRRQPQALSGWTHDAFGGRKVLDEKLEALRGVEIEAGCAADYDELLLAAAGGVR